MKLVIRSEREMQRDNYMRTIETLDIYQRIGTIDNDMRFLFWFSVLNCVIGVSIGIVLIWRLN